MTPLPFTSPDQARRHRATLEWRRVVENALTAGPVAGRCQKCRHRRGDRRRPARHLRACPLRGAGSWRALLGLVRRALTDRLRILSGFGEGTAAIATPHVLRWTLERALELAPDAAKRAPEPVTRQWFIDAALDRFCGVLRYPAVHGLGRDLCFALTDEADRLAGLETKAVLRRGSLTLSVMAAPHSLSAPLRCVASLPGRECSLRFDPTASYASPSVRTVDLRPFRFRMGGDEDTEGVVFMGAPSELVDDQLTMLDAAVELARINAWPGPPRMRDEAAAWVARRPDVQPVPVKPPTGHR